MLFQEPGWCRDSLWESDVAGGCLTSQARVPSYLSVAQAAGHAGVQVAGRGSNMSKL